MEEASGILTGNGTSSCNTMYVRAAAVAAGWAGPGGSGGWSELGVATRPDSVFPAQPRISGHASAMHQQYSLCVDPKWWRRFCDDACAAS